MDTSRNYFCFRCGTREEWPGSCVCAPERSTREDMNAWQANRRARRAAKAKARKQDRSTP